MKIKVFADTICGWCYIGHSRLKKALEEFKDIKFEIEHMPFQLNPDMPKDGIERSRYLEIKFGSKENAQPMYDRMAEEANKQGLNFNLYAIKKTPNTVLSHLLINLSEKENKQNLINIGKEFDINEDKINEFFNLENIERVNSYIKIANEKNITGVPFFEIGNDFISGAQSSSNLASAIKNNFN